MLISILGPIVIDRCLRLRSFISPDYDKNESAYIRMGVERFID